MRWASYLVMAIGLPVMASAQPDHGRPIADIIRVTPPSDACLTQPMLVSQVEAWLGAVETRVPITIEVDLSSADTPVIVRIHRDGDSALKTFDVLPAECASRLRAVSLAIALAIDYTAVERVAKQARDRGSEQARPPSELLLGAPYDEAAIPHSLAPPAPKPRPTPVVQAVSPAGSPPSSPGFALAAGAAALTNVLPEFAFGAMVRADVSPASGWRIRSGALVTERVRTGLGPGRVDTRLAAATAGVCRQMGRVWVAACFDLSAGAAQASGQGFSSTRTTWRVWSAIMPGLELQVPVTGPVSIGWATSLAISWARPRVHVSTADDGEELASNVWPAIGIMTALGLQLSL